MRNLFRRVLLLVAALGMTFGVFAFTQAPAEAWQQHLPGSGDYFVPGPPPGSYLSACVVNTQLWMTDGSRPAAEIHGYDTDSSDCWIVCAQVVYVYAGYIRNGPQVCDNTINHWPMAWAQSRSLEPGWMLGANWTATNKYNGYWAWQTSV